MCNVLHYTLHYAIMRYIIYRELWFMKNEKSSVRDQSDNKHASALHPGQYVRETALKPISMSVTKAAELIGVSRPNVSNFLNGKFSATAEMAARIERAFNIPAQTILDMQAAYDAVHAKEKGTPANTKPYVPPFLAIKANEIIDWASAIDTRIRLAVFLRTLVHSTGHGLSKVDFPGNDDAQRSGWDGFIEASEGTTWIPTGISGWEFGTNKAIKGKADDDFDKSVKALSNEERKKITFVFVTPRRWDGKNAWEKSQNEKQLWKDVRAYDASNLEQWLEHSLAGQAWFANETNMPERHVRSLDACWTEWSEVSAPPLSGALFETAIATAKNNLLAWLDKTPEKPFIIASDSAGEALAFLSKLFDEQDSEQFKAGRDRVIVFDKPGILSSLGRGSQSFIPVATTQEIERELAPYVHKMHCIIVCSRNAANADPNLVLEPLPYDAFRKGLEEMDYGRDKISEFEKRSGRSLTVLRRQLSEVPAVRTPEWARNHETAASLVPFLFIGAWNSENETDKIGMSLIANKKYEDLEKICQPLTVLNDPPMWSMGSFRGVISKIDLLFAIAPAITKEDLEQYFSLARLVLGEDDPSLDLAESERWAAAIHGKTRKFSNAFRKGIAETLVLLAVHGNELFKSRLNINTEIKAGSVISELLPSPLTTRSLEANNYDLPTYAEASPDTFLSIIEEDLATENPATLCLLNSVDSDVFFGGGSSRTGLLWALENLAWNPITLPRVALILARLAEVEINDNLVNKPMHSLKSIFSSWMPQTAASHEQRINILKKLHDKFPDIAWKICISQFGSRQGTGHYSHKPQWRPDGYGYGEPFPTWGPILEFRREAVEMALGWKIYSVDMLGDLVERLDGLDEGYQKQIWSLIKTWAQTASDGDKTVLREKLRVNCLSKRAAKRTKNTDKKTEIFQNAQDIYQLLEPLDLISKYAWLFRTAWVVESYDEMQAEELDYGKREERIAELRTDALRVVFEQQGHRGIFALAEQGQAAGQVGWLLAAKVLSSEQLIQLLNEARLFVAQEENTYARKQLISSALRALSVENRNKIITEVTKNLTAVETVQLLLLAPFDANTWKMINVLNQETQNRYWMDVVPDQFLPSDNERAEAIDRLLEIERPRAAFSLICHQLDKISTRTLFRILSNIAKGGKDQHRHYQLEEYYVKDAFKCLDASSELTLIEKAGLEFAYIDVLASTFDRNETSLIPNLEKYIQAHPELFIQAIVWGYKRKDEGIDPPEFRIEPENLEHLAKNGYKLLHGLTRIPGYNDAGELDISELSKWIDTVRKACSEISRDQVAETHIGELLSSAPIGADGVWPCEVVRDVMEDLRSKHIMRGAHTGLYNARGVHWRGEGGDPERELADKYRKWSQALQFTHPYVSSELLMGMVKTYECQAENEDIEAKVRRRLQ